MPEEPDKEGEDPAARKAAEEWRQRFGREGHEGSHAPHDFGSGEEPKDGDQQA
ncbi:hypothetical protein [Sphingomonas sp. LHG3406-1]|uniref:hypothetical protein n=1 Tax=Sphingomonas sp. LHG3406-1 TaxID=2804617 RepID=UPI002605254B|nr:hypothetical protein [Sphingomonas sp. LHG3406-1]